MNSRSIKSRWVLLGSVALACMVLGLLAGPVSSQVAPVKVIIDGSQVVLNQIDWLGRSATGELYLSQPADGLVSVFDSTGSPLRQYGRVGSGPGEFQQLRSLGWTEDDLWAYDRGLTRVTVLGLGPDPLREIAVPTAVSADYQGTLLRYGLPVVAAVLPGDRLVVRATRPRVGIRDPGHAAAFVVSEAGGWKTVLTIPETGCFRTVSVEGQPGSIRVPFCADPLAAVDPEGEVAVVAAPNERGSFCAAIVRLHTMVRTSWCLAIPPVRLSRRDLDSAVARLAREAPHPDLKAAARQMDNLPQILPPFRRMVVAKDRIWLEKWWRGGARVWRVFDLEGTAVLTATVPENFEIRVVSGSYAWGLLDSSSGLESVGMIEAMPGKRSQR